MSSKLPLTLSEIHGHELMLKIDQFLRDNNSSIPHIVSTAAKSSLHYCKKTIRWFIYDRSYSLFKVRSKN